MTSEEKQEIINAVLAALRTNSKTIGQLTPVSEMSEEDFLELNGGRKVSYGVLFANHMSNDEANEGFGYLDTKKVDKDQRGLVEVHQAPVVFLDAMGTLDGHSLNGGEGLEYRSDYKQIHDFPGGETGAPKQGAVYISKNNFKKFVWNGTDMEELKADECPLFVDYMVPVAFATLPVGSSYYVPSSHKIAVKIDASSTKTYDPLPDALYFFRDKGMIYTWNSSTNKWVPAGSNINVVNNLTDGGEADALSAEQGKVLKGLIDNIGTGSIAAFAQYAVFESVSALPATGVATTGYIVGTHIYAYVGTGGDTADGKYQDLGTLEAAGVSVTTAEDGTFTIHVGSSSYTVNLNHTHENMAKLIVCEESDLPSALDPATIYAITDSGETEIEKLIIRGMEFAGGGGSSTEPKIVSPVGTIDFAGEQTKSITVRAVNITGALSLSVTGDFTVTANGSPVSSISASDAINGVTLLLTKGSNFDDGASLSIGSSVSEFTAKSYNVVDSQLYQPITAVKTTGLQYVDTGYMPKSNTVLEAKVKFIDLGSSKGNFSNCIEVRGSSAGKFYIYIASTTANFIAGCAGADNGTACQILGSPYGSIREITMGNGSFSVDGNSDVVGATPNFVDKTLCLGGAASHIFDYANMEIYEVKIYEGSTLVRNYSPVVKGGGKVGLLDAVTGVFISSATSDELVAINQNS